jgi:hypothetical protein
MVVTFPITQYQKPIPRVMQKRIRVMAQRHKFPPCAVTRVRDEFFRIEDLSTKAFLGWGRFSQIFHGKEYNFIRTTNTDEMRDFINKVRGAAYVAFSQHIRNWYFTIYAPDGKKVGETTASVVGEMDILGWQ